nr:MAG TPA: hypothetical protein [Caudoviricetes sp.]
MRKREIYIQKTSFLVCTGGRRSIRAHARRPIHKSEERRNRSETIYVRDDNEQKGTKERKTISEWHNYKAITK